MDNRIELLLEYSKLNKLIFDNELPITMDLRWSKSKSYLGKTTIRFNRIGEIIKMGISISSLYNCSKTQYTETLIHEMIHLLMAVRGEFRRDKRVHGPIFKSYMNRININFPQYKISIREEKKLDISPNRIKEQNGFLIILDNSNIYFNLYKETITKKELIKLQKKLKRNFKFKFADLYLFTGKYPELVSTPIRLKMETLSTKLQYLKNWDEMESLSQKIKLDSILYRI